MIKTTNAPISGWPDFDFRSLPLNPLSRKQLAGIYDHVRASGSVPPHRSKLLTGVIIPTIFVPVRIPAKSPTDSGINPPGDSGDNSPTCSGVNPPGARGLAGDGI